MAWVQNDIHLAQTGTTFLVFWVKELRRSENISAASTTSIAARVGSGSGHPDTIRPPREVICNPHEKPGKNI